MTGFIQSFFYFHLIIWWFGGNHNHLFLCLLIPEGAQNNFGNLTNPKRRIPNTKTDTPSLEGEARSISNDGGSEVDFLRQHVFYKLSCRVPPITVDMVACTTERRQRGCQRFWQQYPHRHMLLKRRRLSIQSISVDLQHIRCFCLRGRRIWYETFSALTHWTA